jgi:fatty acid desaturase
MNGMLRNEELRALSLPSGTRATLSLLTDWLLIAGTFALAILVPHPLTWAFCYVFMSRQQLALAILMHDGAHRRLYRDARVNDYLCQVFCAAPLFFSMYSYQKLHLKHHRAPLASDDPDLSLIGGYPISKASFLRKIARDAFGISYFKFIRYFIYMARMPKAPKGAGAAVEKEVGPKELKAQGAGKPMPLSLVLGSVVLVNLAVWGVLFSLGHGWYFLFFWYLPAITSLQVLLRIRGIAEHAGYVAGEDQSRNARTVKPSWQTFLCAPHNVNFHIEHHLYPSVPYFRLPELHRTLSERGAIPAENVFRGYGAVLAQLVK